MSAAPKHAARTPFVMLLLGLFGGGMVLLLVLNTASAANEVARHDVAVKGASVEAKLEDLRNEIAASAAPANLAAAAAQLGMVFAGNPAFLVVGPDGRVTVLGRPGAAKAPAVPVAVKPKTAKTSPTPSGSAAKSGAHSTASPTKHGAANSSSSPTGTPSSPTPSSTPTPTLTLGGGER